MKTQILNSIINISFNSMRPNRKIGSTAPIPFIVRYFFKEIHNLKSHILKRDCDGGLLPQSSP